MPASTSRKVKGVKGGNSTPQLDQVQPSYYTSGEDALEAGIELEEKAERFAIGWKAEKYFEKSLGMYQRAMTLDKDGQDAPYNCARVLFLLATDFYLPTKSVDALQESASLYRRSLSLASPVEASDGLPSAFYLDVQFNLAVTLLALSDQLGHSKEDPTTRVSVIEEAIMQFNSVINGQETVLQRQKQEEERMGKEEEVGEEDMHAPKVPPAEGQGEEAQADAGDDGQERSEYTSSLVTPASALETLHNLHLSSLALLDVVVDEGEMQRALQLSLTSLQRAQAIFTSFPDGEKRSPDNEWGENAASLRFSALEIKIAALARRSALSRGSVFAVEAEVLVLIEEATGQANTLLQQTDEGMDLSTTSGRSQHRIYSQHPEQLGDMLLSLARTLLSCMHTLNSDRGPLCQQTWNMLGLASKLFLATLKSIDTSTSGSGSSAVLGVSNASTATTRRRCSLYTSMSTVSLLRSASLFFQTVVGLNEKTREQLLNNGRVYARKAVSEVGMSFLLTPPASKLSGYQLPHGGLDSLRGEADALLTLLRSLHLRLSGVSGEENAQEVETVCANVRQSLLQGEQGLGWKWVLFYPEGPSQGEGLVEQIVGEEGDAPITLQERHFWAQVESVLLQE